MIILSDQFNYLYALFMLLFTAEGD